MRGCLDVLTKHRRDHSKELKLALDYLREQAAIEKNVYTPVSSEDQLGRTTGLSVSKKNT
jgi:hypothetical protein